MDDPNAKRPPHPRGGSPHKGVPVTKPGNVQPEHPRIVDWSLPYVSKESALYSDKAFPRCMDCRMFVNTYKCTLVKGNINPTGGCRYWERKPLVSKGP